MQFNVGNVVELLLPDVPDQDIVRKYHQAPVKVTDSDIERMLQHLKDDAEDDIEDIITGKKLEEVRNFDENVQFKTTQGVRVSRVNPFTRSPTADPRHSRESTKRHSKSGVTSCTFSRLFKIKMPTTKLSLTRLGCFDVTAFLS